MYSRIKDQLHSSEYHIFSPQDDHKAFLTKKPIGTACIVIDPELKYFCKVKYRLNRKIIKTALIPLFSGMGTAEQIFVRRELEKIQYVVVGYPHNGIVSELMKQVKRDIELQAKKENRLIAIRFATRITPELKPSAPSVVESWSRLAMLDRLSGLASVAHSTLLKTSNPQYRKRFGTISKKLQAMLKINYRALSDKELMNFCLQYCGLLEGLNRKFASMPEEGPFLKEVSSITTIAEETDVEEEKSFAHRSARSPRLFMPSSELLQAIQSNTGPLVIHFDDSPRGEKSKR